MVVYETARLEPQHAAEYRALMLLAYLQHPDAFTSSVTERETLPLSWWEQRLCTDPTGHEVVLGVFASGTLVGAVGIARETREKTRHKATLFGMFVHEAHRIRGLGRQLVNAALDHARRQSGLRQLVLTVSANNDRAESLYASCGFERYGVEPDAIRVGDTLVSKVHMWCKLEQLGAVQRA